MSSVRPERGTLRHHVGGRLPAAGLGEPQAAYRLMTTTAGSRLGDPDRGRTGRLASVRGLAAGRFGRAPGGRAGAGLRAEAGQSSVELVALLPLALLVGLAILTLLASRSASGQAAAAAHAGAMALLQDAEPRAAARAALPPDVRARATIQVQARKVTVTVKPATRVGFLADTLTATASADAGPVPG